MLAVGSGTSRSYEQHPYTYQGLSGECHEFNPFQKPVQLAFRFAFEGPDFVELRFRICCLLLHSIERLHWLRCLQRTFRAGISL